MTNYTLNMSRPAPRRGLTATEAVTRARVLEFKALAQEIAGGDAVPEPDVEEVAEHEWAGDLYTEPDVSDPGAAFASFSGDNGEQAWLDRADDGTLTGWVRDADGQSVSRYSDVDAWAIDVDQAAMQEGAAAPVDGAAEDPTAVGGVDDVDAPALDDPAAPLDGEAPPAGAPFEEPPADEAPLDGAPLDEAPAEDPAAEGDVAAEPLPDDGANPFAGEGDADEIDPAELDGETGADTDTEDEEDELDAMLANLEKKSWPGLDGVRLVARRVS
jgi:hypothetical protein